jgi:dsRNA-specific ribonuclease
MAVAGEVKGTATNTKKAMAKDEAAKQALQALGVEV